MLKEPFPSNPSRPTRYSITAVRTMRDEQHSRVYAAGFYSCYAAKHWLRTIMGNEASTRRGNELFLDSGIKLRSYELDEILSHEFTAEEAAWKLPLDQLRLIAAFRRGTWDLDPAPVVTEVKTTTKIVKDKKPSAPAGFVTVTELVKGTPISAMNARALLRASNYVKPAYGWAFGPKDLPAVRQLLGV